MKLRYLDRWNFAAKRTRRGIQRRARPTGPSSCPRSHANRTHIFHLYVVQTENRAAIQESLNQRGIATGIHYPIPIHLQEACKDLGYRRGDFPLTEQAAARILSLPMYPELTPQQRTSVTDTLLQSVRSAAEPASTKRS